MIEISYLGDARAAGAKRPRAPKSCSWPFGPHIPIDMMISIAVNSKIGKLQKISLFYPVSEAEVLQLPYLIFNQRIHEYPLSVVTFSTGGESFGGLMVPNLVS
jgi:hypothetical protein